MGLIALLMAMVVLAGAPVAGADAGGARPAAMTHRAGPAPAASANIPTLGLRTDRFTEGFGQRRPRVVSYGGDPTSLVSGVRWSSWGGARAVGHGTADWVWPGWCVACGSVRLRATVVAFDLRTCAGHPAYARVEWYFPSRGMTFSPRLSSENVCNPRASTHVAQPPHAHCAPLHLSAAIVDRIQVYGAGLHCAGARRLIPDLHLLRHYGHNARFHVGRWWCGSELSMQSNHLPPQQFSCEAGDDQSLWVSVSRTG